MWGNLTLGKIYWKKYWEKINIDTIKLDTDTINWEKFFDRFADYK